MMNALQELVNQGLSDSTLDAVLEDLLEGDAFDDDDDKRTCVALAWSRDNGDKNGPEDCTHERDETVKIGGAEYIVLTDDEADARWDDNLESMLDDGGMVPGGSSDYFDRDKWKRDARMDGRGYYLACYDGNEAEFCITRDGKSEWWFLYRTN